ncbi:MAG: alanine racemase [Pseudomonadota bacterium]
MTDLNYPQFAGTRLRVDLDALVANWRQAQEKVGRAQAAAAVKADAYGLGLEPVAGALIDAGCTDFFVATIEEGVRLCALNTGINIHLLSGLLPGFADICRSHSLIPALYSAETYREWMAECPDKPHTLHLGTGINRLGLPVVDYREIAVQIKNSVYHRPDLLMSHLACADEPDHPMNAEQLDLFNELRALLPDVPCSLSNSAGIDLGPDFHFDMVRPGIALYGGWNLADYQTVASFEARVAQIKKVKKGERIGYGGSHTFDRDGEIAVVSAGYADGYHRSASGSGTAMRDLQEPAKAWIKGHFVPSLGRVSMDLAAFDVTDLPEGTAQAGDWIEIFGRNVSIDGVAQGCGSIGYEMLTSVGARTVRIYEHGEEPGKERSDG